MATHPYTIAVAAAYPPIARFIALALRAAGYRPSVFADGTQVLDCLLEEPVDAAVLDAHLSKIDGLTLCRSIRAVSSIPIVLLVMRDDAHLQAPAKQAGATACLMLPCGAEEVLACIRAVLPPPDLSHRAAGEEP